MSGISGIINLETEYKVSNQSFINSLAHRGLNSINTKRFANKSTFTFYSTFTSIESTLEVQPIVSGNIILTCDARIDNRRELKKLLNLQTNPIPDSELILGLFKKFGKSFVEKIKGDFCIVIYNKEEKKIYLMRDYIGARPLYYIFLPGNIFSFSSEIKSFWNLPQITKKVKKNKVANYLRWLSDLRPYENSTFFENIYSVFPASILEIDLNKNKVKSNYFWKPSIERFLHLKTDKEFAKEFQKLLKNSVTNRINSKYRTASHLSGGLDSSFISILAKTQLKDNHNLITVHHDGENQLCDEKYYTKKVIETGGINNFWITKTNDLNKDLNLTHKILDSPDLLSLPVSLFRIKEMSLLKKEKAIIIY